MKEKLMNVCGKLLFAAFVVFFFIPDVMMRVCAQGCQITREHR